MLAIRWHARFHVFRQLATLLQRKTTIEGLVIEDNAVLENLSPGLDAVVNVTTGVTVSNATALTEVNLPAFTACGGPITIERAPWVTAVSANVLQEVGGSIRLESMDRLTVVTYEAEAPPRLLFFSLFSCCASKFFYRSSLLRFLPRGCLQSPAAPCPPCSPSLR